MGEWGNELMNEWITEWMNEWFEYIAIIEWKIIFTDRKDKKDCKVRKNNKNGVRPDKTKKQNKVKGNKRRVIKQGHRRKDKR